MQEKHDSDITSPVNGEAPESSDEAQKQPDRATEYGGPKGKEPTRYGDWEKNGRCIDF